MTYKILVTNEHGVFYNDGWVSEGSGSAIDYQTSSLDSAVAFAKSLAKQFPNYEYIVVGIHGTVRQVTHSVPVKWETKTEVVYE